MEKRNLGLTGIKASRLGFGCLSMSYMQKNMPASEGGKLIINAIERGIDYIDTAQFYQTYSHISYAVKAGYRDFIFCTKSYAYDKESAEAAFYEAATKSGRDMIDIFMLHETESLHMMRGHQEALKYYLKMKAKGYIKAVGVSTHYVQAARSAALFEGINVVEAVINVNGLGVADGSRVDMENALKLCQQCGKGVVAIKVLGGGNLYKKAAECLQYISAFNPADVVLLGMASKAEIDANADFFDGKGIEGISQLDNSSKSLHIEDWCTGCGKCIERCSSKALSIVLGKACCDNDRCLRCGYCSQACPQMALKIFASGVSE